MRILLLIILLFGSCADKETSSQTKSESQLESVSLEMTVETNTNKVDEPILVSYDKGLDLILVQTSFENTISLILGNREEGLDYEAIYWDSNNNQYYTIENDILFLTPFAISDTYVSLSPATYSPSMTHFVYTLDETKQLEPIFDESLREIFPNTDAPLLYIGSISPLERVYLDPTNQLYYIKKLQFFDTSIYETWSYTNDGVYYHAYKPITNKTSPVYPVIKSNIINYYDDKGNIISNTLDLDYRYFTNTNNEEFFIGYYNRGKEFPILYYNN
ncbi:MAG: hypothetical protein ACRCV0_01560 [Brevinema sp.]